MLMKGTPSETPSHVYASGHIPCVCALIRAVELVSFDVVAPQPIATILTNVVDIDPFSEMLLCCFKKWYN